MRKVLQFSLIVPAFIMLLISHMAASAEQKDIRVEKPCRAAAGRFVDNGDGTVTDTKRQLMWQKGDNGKEVTFEQAQEYCRNLRLGGHADWRLPKPGEWDSSVVVQLMMPVHSPMAYARFDLYWSSDPKMLIPFNYRPAFGAEVSAAYPSQKGDREYVRAVRSLTVRPARDGT